ncbi:hypothetical protein MNBD_GAMMA12-2979 [hydrothermal vent metagenome]|uniref:Radical SAM core domain-containing protein n=1 Tax=hydrothermal vent metagenome TaxID=652676 RepID=A0A3B0Y8U9_9ZZZZ
MEVGNSLYFSEHASLTIKEGFPILSSTLSPVYHTLQLGEAIALTFLAAYGNEQQTSEACADNIPDGRSWLNHVIEQYWSYLGGRQARNLSFDWLDGVNFNQLESANSLLFSRKRASPLAVVWLVTLACNRQCPYCFYEITPWSSNNKKNPNDASFSYHRVVSMLQEMQRVGASELYLTGGEPLLRHDLVELISVATSHRIKTFLSTKYPIDNQLATDLYNAGVGFITYSLDAGNEKSADGLAGSKGFFQDSIQSLNALVETNLNFEVNTVVTKPNEDILEELIAFLVSLSVPRVSLSTYIQPTFHQGQDNLTPALNADNLISLVGDLSEKWKGKIEIRVGDSASNTSGQGCTDKNVCEVGYSELHVLPNGMASRCRYLPNDSNLNLGSLEQKTVMEIWHGNSLQQFNEPDRTLYDPSSCYSCNEFEQCNQRGRCYVSALNRYNTHFAPDHFCLHELIK